MKSFLVALLLLPVPAFAWHPVAVCDGGDLVIDQSDTQAHLFQVVLRRNVADWIVSQTHLLPQDRVNAQGEVIQEIPTSGESGYRSFQFHAGEYLQDVKASLESFPPRLEAATYNPKYGTLGPKQIYYFRYCQM